MAPIAVDWDKLGSLDGIASLKPAVKSAPKAFGGGDVSSSIFSNPLDADSLPPGFPHRLESTLSWSPLELSDPSTSIFRLTPSDVIEVRSALAHFKDLGLDGHEVEPSNFPLPQLSKKLQILTEQIYTGTGFALLKGLNHQEFSHEDNLVIYLGISSYIAPKRGVQDSKGNMLAHIREAKHSVAPQDERPVRHSNATSYFHTDPYCDIVAMQMRSLAARGGRHSVASSWRIYNELAATRSDVIRTLATPNWHFDTRERFAYDGGRPLLFYEEGNIIFDLRREPVVGAKNIERPKHIPTATPQQIEALDVVERIARANEVELPMQPGDLAFINNFAIVHRRQRFVNTSAHTRYLVRLWLKNEEMAWKLPEEIGYGNRCAFDVDETEMQWNVIAKEPIAFSVLDRVDLIS